jgi:hypothetical protein
MLLQSYTTLKIKAEERVQVVGKEGILMKEKTNSYKRNTRKNGQRYKVWSRRNNNRKRNRKRRRKEEELLLFKNWEELLELV